MISSLNIILLCLAIVVVALFLKGSKTETYKPGAYIPRPEENGFVRPLWGKGMPVQSKAMSEQNYKTFGSIPQCMPPYPTTQNCLLRAQRNVEVPYSYNKI
ncbi:MAG TPA: hypothetical protein PKD85_00445 [Saprospiraceae bacterium]|nr:hypothetical protein [Saprospiraceae bacterium]